MIQEEIQPEAFCYPGKYDVILHDYMLRYTV